jgi:ABC-type bacteriocin/lantibiotic exporter with double-glycine peptidase domain
MQNMSCGLFCIKFVLERFNKFAFLDDIRVNIKSNFRLGTKLIDMHNGLNFYGLKNLVVEITKETLLKAPLPAILFLPLNHYVVLLKVDDEECFTIYDPGKGIYQLSSTDFYASWINYENHKGICVLIFS